MPRLSRAQRAAKEAANEWEQQNLNIASVVKALLARKTIRAVLQASGTDYLTEHLLLNNARQRLQDIHFTERYSGIRRSIVAALLGGTVTQRLASRTLALHRKVVARATEVANEWDNETKALEVAATKRTISTNVEVRKWVTKWIHDNTSPSSNSRNVVCVVVDGVTYDHVTHWRTETIEEMFHQCKLESLTEIDGTFEKSFFASCIPPYVRLKEQQEGLCPVHYTGHSLEKEFRQKRAMWHMNCNCACDFCSSDGCDHGKSPADGKCSMFACSRCIDVECPMEYNNTSTNWLRPIQQKHEGGGLYWTNVEKKGTRTKMVTSLREEMKAFVAHTNHVIYHKVQIRQLLVSFRQNEIVVKADFIQNIVHSRGRETSQSYYGKRQTQFLSFVVWFWREGDLEPTKHFFDYLSSYLKHNSLYFQKCMDHLLQHLEIVFGIDFTKIWINTDGGRGHFKSRISFYFASEIPRRHKKKANWMFDPSNHGKGECDSHGAVIKKAIRRFILNDNHHIDNEEEAVVFINSHVANTTAFLVTIGPEETEQDCTGLYGSNAFHEFRFTSQAGQVQARKYPCVCAPCMDENYSNCINKAYAGSFVQCTMKALGQRGQTARYNPSGEVSQSGHKPIAIHADRVKCGRFQYQVQWEGYDDWTWNDADQLDCLELIEEYQANLD